MAMASDLSNAYTLSYSQLAIKWAANTLDTSVAGFATVASPLFDDNVPNDRPVGNWLVLIQGLVSILPAGAVGEREFNQIVEYVARMSMAAFAARALSLITLAQANALLAAWNAAFGT